MYNALLMIVYFAINAAFARDFTMVSMVFPIFIMILFFSYMKKEKYVDASDVIWICLYLFFVIAPMQSFSHGYFDEGRPAAGIYFTYGDIASACAIVGVFIFAFGIVYSVIGSQKIGSNTRNIEVSGGVFIVVALAACIAFVAFVAASGGLRGVMASRAEKLNDTVAGLPTLSLAVQVIMTHVALVAWMNRKIFGIIGGVVVIFVMIILCISQNPFNTPRFFLISTWVPVLFIILKGRLTTAIYYVLTFSAIIFLMPILSLTTRSKDYNLSDLKIDELISNALKLPFMDVFDALCTLVQRMEVTSFSYGHKFVSLVFFFVPRSIWEGKATLTGLDVGEYLYYARIAGTSNLSMFIGGDFYADLGLPGVAVGAVIVALFLRWFFVRRSFLIEGQPLKGYLLIAFLPILIRGPVGATVGLMFVECVVLGLLSGVLAFLHNSPRVTAKFPAGVRKDKPMFPAKANLLLGFAVVLSVLGYRPAVADPVIFWASDPVSAGDAVLISGADFGAKPPALTVRKLSDAPTVSGGGSGSALPLVQASDTSLKVRIPEHLGDGVYEISIVSDSGAVSVMLNAPTIYWAQGDQGETATPGGWVRVQGRNIVRSDAAYLSVRNQGARAELMRLKPVEGGLWDSTFQLPSDIRPGTYDVDLWNGQGDAKSIRSSRIIIAPKPEYPSDIVNLRDFGAGGDGINDDAPAMERALRKLRQNGGGTLFIPRGTYLLSGTIELPPRSRMRGEDRDLSVLIIKNQDNPPDVFISGQRDFAVENMTLLAANHWHLIAGGFGGEDGGNISIDRVTIRASFYREHLKPDKIQARYLKSISVSGNGPDAIRLRGRNIFVTNSDIYSSVRSIYIPDSRYIYIKNNNIYNGRRGWYSISRSSEIIMEGNTIEGADLQSSGGGINTLFGSHRQISANVLFKGNRAANLNGMDGEAMTADGPGGCYWGQVRFQSGNSIAELGASVPGRAEALDGCSAGALVVVDGRGKGAYALIKTIEGRTVTLDRPMPLDSAADTIAVLTPIHMRYLAIGNQGVDTGAFLQAFGGSLDQVFADNSSFRSGGYSIWAGEYLGYPQSNFYLQMIRNRNKSGYISGVFIYKGATSMLRIYNEAPPKYEFPLVRGVILRENRLEGNASISVGSRFTRVSPPLISDVIIERNIVMKADTGIEVGPGTDGVVIEKNEFEDVKRPVIDRSRASRPTAP